MKTAEIVLDDKRSFFLNSMHAALIYVNGKKEIFQLLKTYRYTWYVCGNKYRYRFVQNIVLITQSVNLYSIIIGTQFNCIHFIFVTECREAAAVAVPLIVYCLSSCHFHQREGKDLFVCMGFRQQNMPFWEY